MDFNFNANDIIVSLIFSSIGFFYFRRGKKEGQLPLVGIGFVLMIYSYFTPTLAWNIGVGVALTLAPLILPYL